MVTLAAIFGNALFYVIKAVAAAGGSGTTGQQGVFLEELFKHSCTVWDAGLFPKQ